MMPNFFKSRKNYLIAGLVVAIVLCIGVAIGLANNFKKPKSEYIQSLEAVLRKQAKAETITAIVITDPENPNIVNIQSAYFLAEIFSKLDQMPKSEEATFKDWAKENINWLPAPIITELGLREFPVNQQEGLKWATIGLFHAFYDAKRCKNPRAAISPMSQLWVRQNSIMDYVLAHPRETLTAMENALDWDERHFTSASPMWLCDYSLDAVKFDQEGQPIPVSTKSLLHPEETWEALWESVHHDQRLNIEKRRKAGQ